MGTIIILLLFLLLIVYYPYMLIKFAIYGRSLFFPNFGRIHRILYKKSSFYTDYTKWYNKLAYYILLALTLGEITLFIYILRLDNTWVPWIIVGICFFILCYELYRRKVGYNTGIKGMKSEFSLSREEKMNLVEYCNRPREEKLKQLLSVKRYNENIRKECEKVGIKIEPTKEDEWIDEMITANLTGDLP